MPEAPPTCQSIILTGGVVYLLQAPYVHNGAMALKQLRIRQIR